MIYVLYVIQHLITFFFSHKINLSEMIDALHDERVKLSKY
jgi:hypothetical protein